MPFSLAPCSLDVGAKLGTEEKEILGGGGGRRRFSFESQLTKLLNQTVLFRLEQSAGTCEEVIAKSL